MSTDMSGRQHPHTYCITSLPQLLKNAIIIPFIVAAHWGAVDTPGNPHHFGFEVNIAGHAGGVASYLGTKNFEPYRRKPSPLQAVPELKSIGEKIFSDRSIDA